MKPDTRSFYVRAVQRSIEHIAAHLDVALDLHALAARACLSPFHFHRIFRGMVGETPLELSRRLRLERAAWQLIHTDRGVTEIAFDAGYETHEGFTRAFRAHYGTSPSGFRRRKRPSIEIPATCGVHYTGDGVVTAFIPRDSGGRAMDVVIKDMPDLRIATVRHIGPYDRISEAFTRLGMIAGRAGLFTGPPTMLAIYYDDPESTPPEQLRSDAGFVVPEDASLPPELTERRLSAGRYACTVHVGPYERLGETWARFMGEWLPASGYRLGEGVSYEIYVSNPMTAPDEEPRTELYIPIA
ncbi:MAG TPA: AraC family transcriptional regulator [Longimicrobiales bacterium]